jgi:pyruvate/2-oxoglutarate dehydrogenase complex dihydrolipoamide dehydrogenase (E3) component
VRFINPCVPSSLTKTDDGKISVVYRYVDGDNKDQEVTEVFDTVLFAIGRTALTDQVNIQATGVKTHARSSKIIVTDAEETNVSHIYAIGDCVCDANGKSRPELTPVAIKAGELLSARVFGGASKVMDYTYIATTVFTPIEYGVCGLSEEEAREIHGDDNVEVYHVRYGTLETAVAYVLDVPPPRTQCFCGKNYYAKEFALAHGNEWIDHDVAEYEFEERQRKHLKQPNLAKLVVDKKNDERVIGFHYIGPQAGEVTQGFALALKKGATKADFDDLVGIHPTTAEEFCSLKITKSRYVCNFLYFVCIRQ